MHILFVIGAITFVIGMAIMIGLAILQIMVWSFRAVRRLVYLDTDPDAVAFIAAPVKAPTVTSAARKRLARQLGMQFVSGYIDLPQRYPAFRKPPGEFPWWLWLYPLGILWPLWPVLAQWILR
jgi:hypothetical protein